jgi:hypothetical protein
MAKHMALITKGDRFRMMYERFVWTVFAFVSMNGFPMNMISVVYGNTRSESRKKVLPFDRKKVYPICCIAGEQDTLLEDCGESCQIRSLQLRGNIMNSVNVV